MRRLAAAALALLLVSSCGDPPRWEERGFGSETECWLNHGWDGTVKDGVNRNEMFEFWCG